MTQNNSEFRIKHLIAFLLACTAYNLLAFKFSPASGAIALFTALLLSIEPERDTKAKYISLIIASVLGISIRSLSALDLLSIHSWLPEVIVGLAGIIFVASHIKRSSLNTFVPLSFFLLLFSFLTAGAEATRYVTLIFFPLAGAFALSVALVRMNEKIRIHRRARLRKERSI